MRFRRTDFIGVELNGTQHLQVHFNYRLLHAHTQVVLTKFHLTCLPLSRTVLCGHVTLQVLQHPV